MAEVREGGEFGEEEGIGDQLNGVEWGCCFELSEGRTKSWVGIFVKPLFLSKERKAFVGSSF